MILSKWLSVACIFITWRHGRRRWSVPEVRDIQVVIFAYMRKLDNGLALHIGKNFGYTLAFALHSGTF